MKRVWMMIAIATLLLGGCGGTTELQEKGAVDAMYMQITAEEAKTMMDESEEILILDVREQSEFDEGHIPGAVLLPVGSITEETAAGVIADKETVTLVYCRSGNRSKTAAQALVALGYTQIYEFGGIRDWPYEVEE